MVNRADLERMDALADVVKPVLVDEGSATPPESVPSVEENTQAKLLRVIEEIEKVIRMATIKLNTDAQKDALARLKFRAEDGLMMPNVNSCITGMQWLEALGKLNAQVLELVRLGAEIPSKYLALQEDVDSLGNQDFTLGKEERRPDLRGQK